ncbi:MAG: hypothetical protein JW878_09765 [Methanomicrobia archaeon]|nr:hypothetical protein [Methanomicrobia archaeon]
MIGRMQRQHEQAEKRARKIGMKIPVPPLGVEIATLLFIFLGVESLISLLLAPDRLNAQGYLHIVALAAFPLAYGIWAEKRWGFYATLILIEPLLLIYPFIVAFSPYFGIEYNWISVLSFVAVGLAVLPLLITNERYADLFKGTKLQMVFEKLPFFNVLFIIFGLALVIRTVLPYDTVFKDTVRFASDDAVFHMRLVENALFGDHFPSRPFFDAYTLFPHGTYLHFAPLFEQIIIFATWIISLGAPTKAVMEAVGAYFPAILGSLVVFPVYIIGKELYNKYAGFVAAVLVATLPGQFLSRSIIGFTDHHVAEALLSTILMMILIIALKRAKADISEGDMLSWFEKKPKEWLKSKNSPFLCYIALIVFLFYVIPWAWWVFLAFILFLLAPLIFTVWKKPDSYLLYTCLAGLALGFYLLTWFAGLVFIFVIFAYGVIHYTINGLRGESNEYICVTLIPVFLIALLMILPFFGRPFPYDIRHVATLSMGIIVFSIPPLFKYLTTKVGYRHEFASEERGKAEPNKPQTSGTEYVCPICGKKSKTVGIVEHIKRKHSSEGESKSNRKVIKQFFADHPELSAAKKSGIESISGSSPLEKIAHYEFLLPSLTVLVLFVLSWVFFPSILNAFNWFSPSGVLLTIAENHPMDTETAWIWFGMPFFVSLFAMALLVINVVKRDRSEEVLLLVWSVIIMISVGGFGVFGIETIGMNRFAYYYTVNAAILTGFFAAVAFDALTDIGESEKKEESAATIQSAKKGAKAKSSESTLDLRLIVFAFAIMAIAILGLIQVGIESLIPLAGIVAIFFVWMHVANTKKATIERPLRKTLAILLIMVIVFYPFPLNAIAKPFPSTSNLPLSAAYAINTAERGIGADENWYEALRWMRNNTPEPGVDYYGLYDEPPLNDTTGAREDYNYPSSAYGVMSWWDYGHMITWIAHRIPNANPFQQGIGKPIGEDPPGASTFFILNTEEEANEVADTLGVRYVISDFMMADIWNAYYNKYGAMTVWAGDPERYSSLSYYYTTMEARLHMFDGAQTDVNGMIVPALAHYRLVHEAPTFVLPMIIMDENTGAMYWRSFSADYSTTATQAQILHGHLFDLPVGPWIEDPLNEEELPEMLTMAFNSSGIPFSEQSTVSKVSEGQWTIRDEINNNIFIINKDDGQLQVYLYGVKTGQSNVKAWTPEYIQPVSFVKVFEYVEGARIEGTASNGSLITISTDITTNYGRTFTYALDTTAAANDSYEFIVPYSTEGPMDGGTNFDVSVAPYTLKAGHFENDTIVWDVEKEVRITEEEVIDGRTIRVDLLE